MSAMYANSPDGDIAMPCPKLELLRLKVCMAANGLDALMEVATMPIVLVTAYMLPSAFPFEGATIWRGREAPNERVDTSSRS